MRVKLLVFTMMLVLLVNVWAQTPAPTGLTAEISNGNSVQLNWLTPDLPFSGIEGFEGAVIPSDFSIFNVNNDNTWGILDGGYNSAQCAACFYDDPANDDWLVSPAVDVTAASEFSFMAGNYSEYCIEEEFEVYISNVGPNPGDFPVTPELSYVFSGATVTWESFLIDLSSYAGQTIWLGIHCTSPNMWYLKIDDFAVSNLADGSEFVLNFESQKRTSLRYRTPHIGESKEEYRNSVHIYNLPEQLNSFVTTENSRDFIEYNIYRDNFLLGTSAGPTYLDENLATDMYEYYVIALFDEGESIPSNTVSIYVNPDLMVLEMRFDLNGTYNAWEEHGFNWTWDGYDSMYFGNPIPALSLNNILNDTTTLNASGELISVYSIEMQAQTDIDIEVRGFNNGLEVYTLPISLPGTSPMVFPLYSLNFEEITDLQFYSPDGGVRIDNMLFMVAETTTGEGFESGDLAQYPWISEGDLGWSISEDAPYGGTYCAKSGAILDNQESLLSINLEIIEAGDLSFANKVSSEADYDSLEFYIDGTMQDSWSGEVAWVDPSSNIYPVTVGNHTFSWRYMKDAGTPGGEDCAWIDDITFPTFETLGSISGNISNPDEVMLEGALISLNTGQFETVANVDGDYAFPALNPGDFDVTISFDAYSDYAGNLTVTSGENTTLDVVLTPLTALSVSGIVEDEFDNPIENASVSLDGEFSFNTTTNALGEFIFDDVMSDNTYDLIISKEEFETYVGEVVVANSNIDLGVISLTELIYPVTEIIAELNANDQADISWAEPGVNISDEFRHDDGVYYNCMSFSPEQFPDHMFGSAFRYKALVDELKWWLVDGNQSGHPVVQLLVFGLLPDGSPDSGNLIFDTGWIPNTDNEWNTYALPEQLDLAEGFFVGLRVNAGGGTYIVFDDGLTEEYPGSYPHTTTYEGEFGNAWGNNNTNNGTSWFEFDFEGRSCNVMVRATGLNIEELTFDGESITTVNIEDSDVTIGKIDRNRYIAEDDHISNTTRETREVESYDVWRVAAGDEEEPNEWEQIETGIETINCVDEEVSNLPSGLYRYAVKANYPGGYVSDPKFSYFIVWDMISNLTVNVETGNNDPTTGTYVRLIGEDGLAALYDENNHQYIIENNNSVSIDVWKQEWTLYVDLIGYEPYIQENLFIFNDTVVEVELIDVPIPAWGVDATLNSTNTGYVDIGWEAAIYEILWDQYDTEGCTSTRVFQDFMDVGWQPFDAEGAFDIVLNEPAEITRLDFWIYNNDEYYEPIPLRFMVFEDFESAPRENWVDSLDTQAAEPNLFWEYRNAIDPPLALDAGTHWFGVQAMVPIMPNYDVVGFRRRFTLGNGTEFFYRMPGDGYGNGWANWLPISEVDTNPGTELCARVIGRTASTTRSVTGYNIYRLLPGQEEQPELWFEVAVDHPDLVFTDETVTIEDDYKYAVEAVFPGGILAEAAFSNELHVIPGSNTEGNLIPIVTELAGNYPNPFNPETTIKFSLKSEQNVSLKIYNMRGQLVKTLVNKKMEAAYHKLIWDGKDDADKTTASGVYFYRMISDEYKATKKMMLLK